MGKSFFFPYENRQKGSGRSVRNLFLIPTKDKEKKYKGISCSVPGMGSDIQKNLEKYQKY